MQPSNIIRHNEAETAFQRGRPAGALCHCRWRTWYPSERRWLELTLTPPKDPLILNLPPFAIAKLQRLHAAAGELTENAPEIIANPDAARGLEQALIEALVDCLTCQEDRGNNSTQGQHAMIMRRFRRVVEENPEQPLYIPEICKAIRVPSRTLRMVCQEHFGMGPKRYLVLRRMHLARRALREAVPDATSVTDVATRYGFWQLGRFAVEYQSLFGESPSATLRRGRSAELHSRSRDRTPNRYSTAARCPGLGEILATLSSGR